MTVTIEARVDPRAVAAFGKSREMRTWMRNIGVAIQSRAVPKTGIDTGLLRSSMDFEVIVEDGSAVVVFGSNVSKAGMSPVEYAMWHWAPGKPGGRRARWQGTRPWSRSFRELGIPYTAPKGFDV